jgi:hypothetical protein
VDSGYVTSRLTGRKSYQYLLADPIGSTSSASDSSVSIKELQSAFILMRLASSGLRHLGVLQNYVAVVRFFTNDRMKKFNWARSPDEKRF